VIAGKAGSSGLLPRWSMKKSTRCTCTAHTSTAQHQTEQNRQIGSSRRVSSACMSSIEHRNHRVQSGRPTCCTISQSVSQQMLLPATGWSLGVSNTPGWNLFWVTDGCRWRAHEAGAAEQKVNSASGGYLLGAGCAVALLSMQARLKTGAEACGKANM
jgi:hypothetical protein